MSRSTKPRISTSCSVPASPSHFAWNGLRTEFPMAWLVWQGHGAHQSKALDPSFHLPCRSSSESVWYLKYRARTALRGLDPPSPPNHCD